MKIATWNIERLKHATKLGRMRMEIEKQDADVLVLTEADTRLQLPSYPFRVETESLEAPFYRETERRVIIHSRFPVVGHLPTYDQQTAICPLLQTDDNGIVACYGTVLGIYGNREASYETHLKQQVQEWREIVKTPYPLVIAGNLNMSFSDNYYYTKKGRAALLAVFKECDLEIHTDNIPEMVDHIVMSKSLRRMPKYNVVYGIDVWNTTKYLSDHVGISSTLCYLRLHDDDG
jgi:endonuclease/exonuclease/phosphatase family metal-dependent hydrolase